MIAAYVVAAVIIVVYAGSLMIRFREAQRAGRRSDA
jgi:hypothetical protein